MKRFFYNSVLFFAALIISSGVIAQTNGAFTFNATTINQGGAYAPNNIVAIWITTSTGTFVKTLKKQAGQRVQYLSQWKANSASNVVDAITGVTLSNHIAHTVTWNGKNVSQALVPDGDYKVWIEFTDRDSPGPNVSFLWTKGPNAQTLTPTNAALSNVSLQWAPNFSSVKEEANVNGISVYPNPFKSELNFSIDNSGEAILVDVFDFAGKKVAHLEKLPSSLVKNVLTWNGISDNGEELADGIYFYSVSVGNQKYSGKVFLSR